MISISSQYGSFRNGKDKTDVKRAILVPVNEQHGGVYTNWELGYYQSNRTERRPQNKQTIS